MEVVGEQASILYEEAQQMIEKIIAKQLLKPKAIFGLFAANTINEDDISVQKKGRGSGCF
jgi:5-methyltetrahydrofolate--homocysteine methyltransferase